MTNSYEILDHNFYMGLALEQAKLAKKQGEVPVGCIIVYNPVDKGTGHTILDSPRLIASSYNTREVDNDPSSHAEFKAILSACKSLGNWRLSGCTVYVTLEPCIMCTGLMLQSRIDACIFGAFDKKAGACGTLYNLHQDSRLNHEFYALGGVREMECAKLLSDFFKNLRK